MRITLPNWPISRGFAAHTVGWGGIDYSIVNGTPLPACFNGRISLSRFETGGFGNRIDLTSTEEPQFTAVYAHCQKLIGVGQIFNRGQIIGHSDNTGLSTAPHLHLTLLLNSKAVDPALYLKGGEVDMVNKDLLNAFFIDLLGRSPDPGAISTYQDKPDWPAINVYHAIRSSPERQQYVDQKRIKLEVLENQLGNLDREVVALRVEVKTLKESIAGYEVVSDYNKEQIETQRKNILEQEKEIEVLNKRIVELAIQASGGLPKPSGGLTAIKIKESDVPLVKLLKRFYNWVIS